jgi:hypothetical protein
MPARHELDGHIRDDVLLVPQVARYALIEDIDGDGDDDLVLYFKTQETGIVRGDTSASLTGKIFGWQAIEGSDSLRAVGCQLWFSCRAVVGGLPK